MFFERLMKRHGRPVAVATDEIRFQGGPPKELGMQGRRVTDTGENDRAENSHQPFQRRESAMLRFWRVRSLQRSGAAHSWVENLSDTERTLSSRPVQAVS